MRNMLYGINRAFGGARNEDGQFTLLDIAYAQYVKSDFDFAMRVNIDTRNSIVFHLSV